MTPAQTSTELKLAVLTSDPARPQNQLVYIATHGTQAKVSTHNLDRPN